MPSVAFGSDDMANIYDISVTFFVLDGLSLKIIFPRAVSPKNIYDISVTFEVSQKDKSKEVNALSPEKALAKLVVALTSKLSILSISVNEVKF